MRKDQRQFAERNLQGDKEGEERSAEHDLWRGEREEDEEVNRLAEAESIPHQRHGHERADGGGDDRGDKGDSQRGPNRLDERGITEERQPVVKGE